MTGLNEEIKNLILIYLAKWKTTRVNKERLVDLKDEIIKKTGAKSLPLATLKKWIRKTVRETKQVEKLKELQLTSPIVAPLSERAYQQTILFDIAALKKITEKTLTEIEEIRKLVSKKPKNFRKKAAPQIAATRKTLEKISERISEISKKLS